MKNKAWLKGAVSAGVTVLLLAPLAAQADVKIETLTHLNDITGISNHDSDTTDYFQGDKKREENLRKFTGSVMGAWQKFRGEDKGSMDIDIYDVSANKHWNLDPQKKVYSVEAIYDPNQPSKAPPQGGSTQQQQKQDQDVKVTKNEFTVKDTGQTKTINGFDTHEYLVTWDVETVDTKTVNILEEYGPRTLSALFGDHRPPPEIKFGIGDVVSVTIFEAAAGGLFIPAEASVRPGRTRVCCVVESGGNRCCSAISGEPGGLERPPFAADFWPDGVVAG